MANIMTPEFRVSFPNVFEPKMNKLSGKEEYNLVLLFAPDADLTEVNAAVLDAVIAKWGNDKSKWPTPMRNPVRNQGEKAKNVDGKMVLPDAHVDGAFFINTKSKLRPGLVDQNVKPIIDQTQFYAGCYARATLNAYAYDQMGNRGVAFGLVNIQKLRDGDPLGNRTRPDQDFAAVDMGTVASGGDGSAADIFS